ncbi:carbon-nitrogen hydrolase family protein [Dethiothermospora halolimnae]|uniref:carbon-nitrogen hydrolase family protein n=1 Tax=Dethiothermospora halolimnae TaxID=3114390 RepID=UPI003CCBB961
MSKVKVGLCQMTVTGDKGKNISKAQAMVEDCVKKGVNIVVLPEMFNCPYDNSYFPKFAETYPTGETIKALSNMAKDNGIYLVGGSIPEKDGEGKIYNTSFVFDYNGELIGRHRKMHLFDIDVAGGVTFKESDTLAPGNDVTIFDTKYGKFGLCICYDIRFPELIRIMALEGVRGVFVPAAFNMTTGPAHWEILFRSRALDNQIYMLGTAPARNEEASYTSYGNSIIVDSWGSILERLGDNEGVIITEIDLDKIDKTREQIPTFKHRRTEIYDLKLK